MKFKHAENYIRTKYRGMGVLESGVWTQFLKLIGWKDIVKVSYNVRVGKGIVPDNIKEPNIVKMAVDIQKLRIDAVVERANEIWIIEVKTYAGLSAVGQLVSYRDWYVNQKKPFKPVKLGLVCIDYNPNLELPAKKHGIVIFQVKYGQMRIID